MQAAIAGFVGALSALIVMAEIQMANRWAKYLVCLIVGLVLTIILGFILDWVVAQVGRA